MLPLNATNAGGRAISENRLYTQKYLAVCKNPRLIIVRPCLHLSAKSSTSKLAHIMAIPFTGGCACGAVRYECSSEPITMFKCHCRGCQQRTGSAFAATVLVSANSFRITQGMPRYHFTASEALGQHKHGFCAECGSRLTGGENAQGTSGVVAISATSLDDPSWFRPRMEIWTSDAQPWDVMDPNVPIFEQLPPASYFQ